MRVETDTLCDPLFQTKRKKSSIKFGRNVTIITLYLLFAFKFVQNVHLKMLSEFLANFDKAAKLGKTSYMTHIPD